MIHKQSAHGRAIIHKDEIVGYGPRERHYAISGPCPRCEARPGGECQMRDGTRLGSLAVHVERAQP